MDDHDTVLTPDDEGKRVLTADGDEVGRLVDVTGGRGYVERDPSLLDSIAARLGWADVSADAHPLDEGSIEEITDDAVLLRGRL